MTYVTCRMINRLLKKRTEVNFAEPYQVILFGVPIVISLTAQDHRAEEFYYLAWRATRHLIKNFGKQSDQSNDWPIIDGIDGAGEGLGGVGAVGGGVGGVTGGVGGGRGEVWKEASKRLPFKLKVVNKNGSGCAVCKKTFCLGCELDFHNHLLKVSNLISDSVTFAIDWHPDVYLHKYDHQRALVCILFLFRIYYFFILFFSS